MAEILEATCAVCSSPENGGDFSLRKELRKADGAWVSNTTLATYRLCADHFEWAHSLLWVSTSGGAGGQVPLGIPLREGTPPGAAGACDLCGSLLPAEAFGIDLVPNAQVFIRRSLFKHVGAIRQHRICRECQAWWLTTLEDGSAVRGTGMREMEGPPGAWQAACASDAEVIGLLPRDASLLATTVEAAGKSWRPVAPYDADLAANAVLFIGAGRRDQGARLVGRLSAAQRSRTVVVARPDSLDDACAALRLGAAEFLASPLSPQQVSGAIDRIGLGIRPGGRDGGTGLPVYNRPVSLYGHGGSVLGVQLPRHDDVRLVALLLRRYTRGYDLVGADGSGGLQAVVFCPPQHADTVATRLHRILGERSQVKVVSRAQPGAASTAAAAA